MDVDINGAALELWQVGFGSIVVEVRCAKEWRCIADRSAIATTELRGC